MIKKEKEEPKEKIEKKIKEKKATGFVTIRNKKPFGLFNVDLGKIKPYEVLKVKKELADILLKQKYFEEVKTGGIKND